MLENVRVRLRGWIAVTPGWFWAAVVLFVLIAVFIPPLICWHWPATNGFESCSSTIRNFGLVSAAVIALPLAIWRSWVAERQAGTAEHGLLNERYQKGADMLGSKVLSVRLGGIYALERLAAEHPKIYHIQIMQLFCAFVRDQAAAKQRLDFDAVMRAISARSYEQRDIEKEKDYQLNLNGADFRGLDLYNLDLSGISFTQADFSDAFLVNTDFSNSTFFNAKLSGARLSSADLSGASFLDADLSQIKDSNAANFSSASLSNANLTQACLYGANFENTDLTGANLTSAIFHKDGILAKGLTQRQIAFAQANPEGSLPIIDGLIDTETGEMILWSKRPTVV